MKVVVVPTRWDLPMYIVIACLGFGLVGPLVCYLGLAYGSALGAFMLAVPMLGMLYWACWSAMLFGRAFKRQKEELGPRLDDPLATIIKPYRQRSDRVLFRVLARHKDKLFGAAAAAPPLLICIGLVPEFPKPPSYDCEPESHIARWSFVPMFGFLGGMLLALWIVDSVALGSIGSFYIKWAIFGVILVTLIVALLYWIETSRTILRFSPGVIEVLHYPWFGSTPKIHQYPCISGTIAILRMMVPRDDELARGLLYGIKPFVTLSRGPHRDTVPLHGVDVRKLINAMLSTKSADLFRLSTTSPVG